MKRLNLKKFLNKPGLGDRYVAAIKKLKADGVYQLFVDWHADDRFHSLARPGVYKVAHDNLTFLHWHRAYLRLFELELQKADEALQTAANPKFDPDDVISLPFWDYPALNSPNPDDETGRMWRESFMGPTGDASAGDPYSVLEGPFKAEFWQLYHRVPNDVFATEFEHHLGVEAGNPSSHLIRDLGGSLLSGLGSFSLLPTTSEIKRVLEIADFDNNIFSTGGRLNTGPAADSGSFRAVLEGWATIPPENGSTDIDPDEAEVQSQMHNGVHGWVDGTMDRVPIAPNDPVFWLHHANIDRIWAIWQTRHPTSDEQYPPSVDITAIKEGSEPPPEPFGVKQNRYALQLNEAMVPWDEPDKKWRTPEGRELLTTQVITPGDVANWAAMGAELGGYRIQGVSSRKLDF